LGEGLIPPAALVATFRFPLVLVTPVKLAFTCCKHSTGTCEPLVKPNVPNSFPMTTNITDWRYMTPENILAGNIQNLAKL
jgi:hypothetical protein